MIEPTLEEILRRNNPWWNHTPQSSLSPLKRWVFEPVFSDCRVGRAKLAVGKRSETHHLC
jgi:hypothetical protein